MLDPQGHFPVSQDQRNTVRARFRYQLYPRLWFAAGVQSDSGLPFAFTGTQEQALAEYGQAAIDRVNFDRGRVRPSLSVDLSVGADVYESERLKMHFQADVCNLNDRLNVLDLAASSPATPSARPAATFFASPPVSESCSKRLFSFV